MLGWQRQSDVNPDANRALRNLTKERAVNTNEPLQLRLSLLKNSKCLSKGSPLNRHR